MSLLNPILLLGSLLIAAPIILHLFSRNRYKVVEFGAMMFLQASMKKKSRTIKLHQIILLLLRCLFFILLALAMGRPVYKSAFGGGANQDTTYVLILDTSMSMNQADKNTFNTAKTKALDLVKNMKSSDNMIILSPQTSQDNEMTKPAFDKVFLKKKINSLSPGFNKADIPALLERAFSILQNSTLAKNRIYLFTDNQQNSWSIKHKKLWERLKSHKDLLPAKPLLYVIDCTTSEDLLNFAPVAIYPETPIIDTLRTTRFNVEIQNHSPQSHPTKVQFLVDGTLKTEQKIQLRPGSNLIHFDHLFESGGPHYIEIKVSDDDFEEDNTFYYAVNVMNSIPVLAFCNAGNSKDTPDPSYFLKAALESSSDIEKLGLFKVTIKPMTDMDILSIQELNHYKTIVLIDIPSFSDYFRFNLNQFIESGGGVLFTLGPASMPNEYRPFYQDGKGMLPGIPGAIVSTQDKPQHPWFNKEKCKHIIDIFTHSATTRMDRVKVLKYRNFTPAKDAIILATFKKAPFLALKKYGKGNCIAWTTSLGPQWSTFPFTHDYLPLLQNLVQFLSSSIDPPINISVNETIHYSSVRPVHTVSVSQPLASKQRKLLTPDAKEHILTLTKINDEFTALWPQTNRPGIYTIYSNDKVARYFAVNPPIVEGQLQQLWPEEHQEINQYVDSVFLNQSTSVKDVVNQESGISEWWKLIATLAIILLCVELFCSWRFSS